MRFDEWGNVYRKKVLEKLATYMIVAFGCSLRGNEGFMIDLQGLISHIRDGKEDRDQPHIVINLLKSFEN